MDDGLPISVAEFLRSNTFRNGVILLEGEDNEGAAAPRLAGDCGELDADVEETRRRQRFENATRLALLLARSFADICRSSDISYDAAHHHLSRMELGDFFVRLDNDGGRTFGQQTSPAPEGDDGDDLIDCFYQIMSEDEERKKNEVKDMEGRTLGLGYFSSNGNTGFGGDEKVTAPKSVADSKQRVPVATPDTMEDYPQGACDGSLEKTVLYGIDIMFPTRMKDEEQKSMATPVQILGKLIYAIFCLGDSPPPQVSVAATIESSLESMAVGSFDSSFEQLMVGYSGLEDFVEEPSSKRSVTEASLFSQLVDSEAFPVAVCRLLSDIVDTGPSGRADMPFASFGDIVRELEEMISHPLLCLHDSDLSRGVPRMPLFGQVYYGRDEEVARIIAVAEKTKHCPEANIGVEAIFVRGIAGSGKSQLIQTASDRLAGWKFVKAKFERGAAHASRGILSSMFDDVVSLLAKMTHEGSPSEVASCQQASKTILDYIGRENLPLLVDFLPSLPQLFDGIGSTGGEHMEDWPLINCLSKILEAMLESGQHIMLCCDDMHWADRTSLALITEVLTRLGENLSRTNQCFLFIGLYREEEVDDDHPFSIQHSYLQMSSNINTSEVRVSSLSKEIIAEMVMNELRLSRRMIWELADTVYKRTSGHAFFVAELLNSLLRNSTIAYSRQKRRYAWDQDLIDMIQVGENVAELIASKISRLSQAYQRVLRIISCFGIQTDIPLLEVIEKFQEGTIASLDIFIERGILDRAGPIVIFSHDLIQQAAYEGMPLAQRQKMHLEVGEFLGGVASVDARSSIDPVLKAMGQLSLSDQIFFAGSTMTSSLISIACDQIDAVQADAISDSCQLLQYAEWNLCAGQKTSAQSDHRAALYYFSKGISFLGEECWLNDYQLSLALHEGAVFASFHLGEADRVVEFAEMVIKHVSFDDTLGVQQFLLKSLSQLGRHDECIARGTDTLRQLNFDIPLLPTMDICAKAMTSTDIIYSEFSVDDIVNLSHVKIDGKARNIVRIMDAFFLSCYASGSPFLPVITCEIVKHSLKNGVCEDSASAWASYGMFRIAFGEDYRGGRRVAEIVRAMIEKFQAESKNKQRFDIRAHLLLFITIDIWFSSPRDVARSLLNYHQNAVRMKQVDLSMISLQMGWRYLLYGGEKLSLILQGAEERTELIANSCDYAAKYVVLDNALLAELTGKSLRQFTEIDGFVSDIQGIQAEAEAVNNNRLLHHIHMNNLMLAFWKGDYLEAEKSSRIAWTFPTAKMPTIVLVYHTFFAGLVAFRLYRTSGGDDERLNEGIEMMMRMGKWAQITMPVFGNKWLLLKAEHFASLNEHEEAEKLYHESIGLARDHGNIHELGLSYELFGEYQSGRGLILDANDSFKLACTFYKQWGATAIAERVQKRHNLDSNSPKLKALYSKRRCEDT